MKKYVAALILTFLPLFAFASNASGMGWFGTTVVNALIHGVIYGIIFKLFHAMGLGGSLVVGALILGGAYLFYKKSR
ncbi:MAG: hypothetical protein Q7S87_01150 [Agitococcus sp.]|nr:hypothetical protein [Agitococcus sp.]